MELRSQIETLSAELAIISQHQHSPIDLESYIKKLIDARKRITIVNSILQNAQVIFEKKVFPLQLKICFIT